MKKVILISAAAGILWHFLAVKLMGGDWQYAKEWAPLTSGAFAGIASGIHTIWSRKKKGKESILSGIATYYVGIISYWAALLVFNRIDICIQSGGWNDFDLKDNIGLIYIMLMYGTFYGIVLVPLTFITRQFVWIIYERKYNQSLLDNA